MIFNELGERIGFPKSQKGRSKGKKTFLFFLYKYVCIILKRSKSKNLEFLGFLFVRLHHMILFVILFEILILDDIFT